MTMTPEFRAELNQRVERLQGDADAWHAEMDVRMKAAARRMEIDVDFAYKVLMLTTAKTRAQPGVRRTMLVKMSIMDVLLLELADEHLRGEAGR